MPAQLEQTPSVIESTYKAREVEGTADIYFYRPLGFRLAQTFAKLGLTPTGVSLLGCLAGVIAGHLYYYRDLRVNIVGMALHVLANTLDNADGQLARLTNQQSRRGSIIDSVADHFVFASIYIHLALRYFIGGGSPAIFILALGAGASHALQAAAVDYYRTAYLYFAKGRLSANFDSSDDLRLTYQKLNWQQDPWNKLLYALYLNFRRQQEIFAPRLKKLRDTVERLFPHEIPSWLRMDYRHRAQPAVKWWGLLMTNTRMSILFVLLFVKQPVWYFWIELTILNVLLTYLILRQEKMAQSVLQTIATRPDSIDPNR